MRTGSTQRALHVCAANNRIRPLLHSGAMRLGIDLDGVVADFNAGWIRLYNTEFGADIALDAVDSWDAPPRLTHFRHMGDFWRWASNVNGHSLFWHLDPYPDAVPTLDDLVRAGHDIVILTSKPRWAVSDTYEWIARNQLPTTEVHILDNKWAVSCDVYLDDAPHQVRQLAAKRPEAIVCRFERPWNRQTQGTESIASWEDFATFIARLA